METKKHKAELDKLRNSEQRDVFEGTVATIIANGDSKKQKTSTKTKGKEPR